MMPGGGMSKLTILHISDFHFDDPISSDASLILKAYVNDLEEQIKTRGPTPNLIIFSGDLIKRGAKAETFTASSEALLSPSLSKCKLDDDLLFLTPGNHDIDQAAVDNNPELQSGLVRDLLSRDAANAFYDRRVNDAHDAFHFKRLEAYNNFSNRFGGKYLKRATPFYRSYEVVLPNAMRVGILSLNSTWMATGAPNDIDRGRLIIPERAIFDGLQDLEGCAFKIATFHHPTEYLAPHNRSLCRSLLIKHFNLVCTGHVHESVPELTKSPRGQSVFSQAGALYSSRSWYNGYALISFDFEEKYVRFLHRKWDDAPTYRFVDSEIFEFALGDSGEMARVATLIDANECSKPILTELANEHMLSYHTNTSAPKSFAELYVDLPIAAVSHFKVEQTKERQKYTSISEIISSPTPIVIFGGREAGKTTFGLHIALSVCEGNTDVLRTPVFINLALAAAGTNTIAREAKRVLSRVSLQASYEELARSGSFVFIFDNFKPEESRKSAMIEKFIENNPKNVFIMLADENPSGFRSSGSDAVSFTHRSLYIHALSRESARALTKKWLEPSGQYTVDNFHIVMNRIQGSNLPSTAYVVSMIAWTIERQNLTGAINEAALLERFVDGILNKSNPGELSRAALDYTIKENFLAGLAHELTRRDCTTIEKNRLIEFAISYIDARGWKNDAGEFIASLIASGVLACSDDIVAFRYRCLREYFLAKHMSDDEAFRAKVLQKDNFLIFSREIDLFTGLRRRDQDVIATIMDHSRALVDAETGNEDLNLLDGLSAPDFSDPEKAKRPLSLEELDITDETIEKMLDESANPAPSTQGVNDLPAGGEVRNAPQVDGVGTAFEAVTLLGKVVRNSELVADSALKREAVGFVIDGWARLIARLVLAYERTADNAEAKQKLDELKPDVREILDYFIKVVIPVILTGSLYESMATEKLRGIFEKLFSETKDKSSIVKLILAFLIIELTFSHRNSPSSVIMADIENTLKNYRKGLLSEMILVKLFSVYYRPNIGKENRRRLENIYAEFVKGVIKERQHKGVEKLDLVKGIRDQRARIVGADSDAEVAEDAV
jgi:hypothetical protein